MKNLEIKAVLPRVENKFGTDKTESVHGDTITCRNLRPDAKYGDRLVATEDFESIAILPSGSKILEPINFKDEGKSYIAASGKQLYLISGAGEPGITPITNPLPSPDSEITAILEESNEEWVIMTIEGPYRLKREEDGEFQIYNLSEQPPYSRIEIGGTLQISTSVEGRKLNQNYDRSTETLNHSDSQNLASDLMAAYSRICDKARHAGMYIEPVLIRYRYVDSEGRTVYVSPIKLIVSPNGNPLWDILGCRISSNYRDKFDVKATGTRIKLITPEESHKWNKRIKKLIVEASPPAVSADSRIKHADNHIIGQDYLLRFYMPGCSCDMSPDPECLKARCSLILQHFEEVAEKVVEIESPFGNQSEKEFQIGMSGQIMSSTPLELNKSILKRLSNLSKQNKDDIRAIPTILRTVQLPHHFTAKTCSTNGNTTVWGNITQIDSPGWDLGEWATSVAENVKWRASMTIEKGDGKRQTIWYGKGETNMPIEFSPLLYYPSDNATAIEIQIETEDGVGIIRKNLTNNGITDLSVSEISDFQPIKVIFSKDIQFTETIVRSERVNLPGLCVSCRRESSLEPVSTLKISSGDIVRLVPATATTSAWDYSRSRFYAFGSHGTCMLISNAKSILVASQQIDSRPVESERHIVNGIGGVTILAGKKLIKVKGSTANDMYKCEFPSIKALAYDKEDLWLIARSGISYVIPSSDPKGFYVRDLPMIDDICTHNDHTIILTDESGRVWDCTHHILNDKEIEWSCRIYLPGIVKPPVRGALSGFVRITSIGLRMIATAIKARFSATTDCDSMSSTLARLLFSILLEGSLKSATFFPIRATQRSYITLTIKGIVSSDMRLRGAAISYE